MPTTQELQVTLRELLDDQQLEKVTQFITAHPDFNYDLIAPNGASALWWALTPPRGKQPSKDLIQFLLEYETNNGERAVNPTQPFAGWTPRLYVEEDVDYSEDIKALVRAAENTYQAPTRAANRNLTGIAADAQNVHDGTVVKLSKMNLLRLHQRYVADNTPLDDASQSDCEQALRQLLAADFPNPQPSWKQPRFLNSVLAGLDYCFRTSVIKKVRHFLCALHSSIQNYWILYYHSVH